jgi:hypothetical protein
LILNGIIISEFINDEITTQNVVERQHKLS